MPWLSFTAKWLRRLAKRKALKKQKRLVDSVSVSPTASVSPTVAGPLLVTDMEEAKKEAPVDRIADPAAAAQDTESVGIGTAAEWLRGERVSGSVRLRIGAWHKDASCLCAGCARARLSELVLPVERLTTAGGPFIATISGFLSAQECSALVELLRSDTCFSRSRTSDGIKSYRTSYERNFESLHSPLVYGIRARVRALLDVEDAMIDTHGQILRYLPEQSFARHHDDTMERNHRRVATFLIFLNDMPEGDKGGGTRFFPNDCGPLTVLPRAGMAVWWNNVKPPANGSSVASDRRFDRWIYDERVQHEALAPTIGTKYALQWWSCN